MPAIAGNRHPIRRTAALRGIARLFGLACAIFLSTPTLAAEADIALPASLRAEEPALSLVGGDELKLFGFRIYHASLWAPESRFEPEKPIAFHLLYRRGFSRDELVDITTSAWKKLGLAETRSAAWAKQLTAIWQDVAKGDAVTTLVVPGKETRFYTSTGLLGRIDDADFGPAFLGIWLDVRTQLPELRKALMGMKETR